MNHPSDSIREQVSALADGQLKGQAFAEAVADIGVQEELRATWRTYHLVGDVLRSGSHAPCSDSDAFLAKLQQRLAHEPPLRLAVPVAPAAVALPLRAEPANEPVFRWKLVAGAASLVAVAAIGWSLASTLGGAPAGAQMAQVQPLQQPEAQVPPLPPAGSVLAAADPHATSAVAVPTRVQVGNGAPQVMLRDARLDELLAAHQQAGGGSQMPSMFLRNATFEGPSR
ncbi:MULTISPECIES: sigma-E factor negative regulatory protein [unclassified Variovorax]|uniref:sigma-E factor negative regulatory protein n=1 Tax=unclassified Variovorax TaxID=663243 RepID=UPI001BD29FC6|nr:MULTISPECIES: sigma-E factor negative regulatory protein [unclassified Variovorax]